MTSCNYHLINDGFSSIESKLADIQESISTVEIQAKIEELDIDLDNLEKQLTIANKLKLLELVGTDIVSEENQQAIYEEIANELLGPTSFQVNAPGPMEEEEGEW